MSHGQMECMASKLFLEVRHRGNGLPRIRSDNIGGWAIQLLTPPSRIRRGSVPHSSWTAPSSAWNQWSSRLPSHQSAVCFTLISTAIPLNKVRRQLLDDIPPMSLTTEGSQMICEGSRRVTSRWFRGLGQGRYAGKVEHRLGQE